MLDAQEFFQLQFLPYTEYSLSQLQKTDFSASYPTIQTTQLYWIIKTNLTKDHKTSTSVPVIIFFLIACHFEISPLEVSLIHWGGQTERTKLVVASRNRITKRNH